MKKILDISGAFNDETRILVVAFLLRYGESCVCEISHSLNLGQSRLSRHLGILYDAGIVEMRRDGKMVFYAPKEVPSELALQFLSAIRQLDLQLPPKIFACEIGKCEII